jgi:hypothetical protein
VRGRPRIDRTLALEEMIDVIANVQAGPREDQLTWSPAESDPPVGGPQQEQLVRSGSGQPTKRSLPGSITHRAYGGHDESQTRDVGSRPPTRTPASLSLW